MSCFDVQIIDPSINTIEIETCIGDQPASIDIITYDNTSVVEVNHCIALLPSEINDLITVKNILAGSGIAVISTSGIYTISLNDPELTSSDISDFNSSVSGLLPVKNLIAGSGIGISSLSGDFTIGVTGQFGLTGEEVDYRVSNLLVAGNYVNLNYNDSSNSLIISVTGVQPSGDYIDATSLVYSSGNGFKSIVGYGYSNSAIGTYSIVNGGLANKAIGVYSVVNGGIENEAIGQAGVVCGGIYNVASGDGSTIGGGENNIASGPNSIVGGGSNNIGNGENSVIIGGKEAVTDRYGMTAFATGKFLTQGDAQRVQFLLRNITTNDTPTNLFLDGSSAPLSIPPNKTLFATITVAGVVESKNKFAHYVRKVAVKNDIDGVSIIGNVSTIGLDTEFDSGTDYDMSIEASDGALRIIVTGKANETIRWLASVDGIEMSYTPSDELSWYQQGSYIYGTDTNDQTGWSLSLNAAGNVVVIGSPLSSVNGDPGTGRVKVYVWDGTSWTQRGNDIEGENDPSFTLGAKSGHQVSINDAGDVIAIGAFSTIDLPFPFNIANPNRYSYATIYAWDGSNWVKRGNNIPNMGASISLDSTGNSIAVGSHVANGCDIQIFQAGRVQVYDWNGNSWVQRGEDICGANYEDWLGISVSLNSAADVLAVGTLSRRFSRVYAWNGDEWVQRGDDFNDGENVVVLNADGTVLALADPLATIPNSQSDSGQGRVRVYDWNGSSWVQRGTDIYGVAGLDQIGISLSLNDSGDVLAAGSLKTARVYSWNNTSWVQRDPIVSVISKQILSLNSSGNLVAVGEPLNNDNGTNSGRVGVYSSLQVEPGQPRPFRFSYSTGTSELIPNEFTITGLMTGYESSPNPNDPIYITNISELVVNGVALHEVWDGLNLESFVRAGFGINSQAFVTRDGSKMDIIFTETNGDTVVFGVYDLLGYNQGQFPGPFHFSTSFYSTLINDPTLPLTDMEGQPEPFIAANWQIVEE